MIFNENGLLADNSHVISCPFFFRKLEKMSQNLSSAAVVNGVLRVKISTITITLSNFSSSSFSSTVSSCSTLSSGGNVVLSSSVPKIKIILRKRANRNRYNQVPHLT